MNKVYASIFLVNTFFASNVARAEDSSFMNFALGKKWAVSNLPCDLNGGTYSVYDKDKGYIFVAKGKETVNQARSTVEYKDLGKKKFTLTQVWYSNDFVERMLKEENVISMKAEWAFERLSKDTVVIHKKNTGLNFDLMVKGVKQYDVASESSQEKLCPKQ